MQKRSDWGKTESSRHRTTEAARGTCWAAEAVANCHACEACQTIPWIWSVLAGIPLPGGRTHELSWFSWWGGKKAFLQNFHERASTSHQVIRLALQMFWFNFTFACIPVAVFCRNMRKKVERMENVQKRIESSPAYKIHAAGNGGGLPRIRYCPGSVCPGHELRRNYTLYEPQYRYVANVYHNYLGNFRKERRKKIRRMYQELKSNDDM